MVKPCVSSIPSQSILPMGHFLFLFMMLRISVATASGVFPVVSSSHTLSSSCSCRASVRLTSRISAARFSQSFVFW